MRFPKLNWKEWLASALDVEPLVEVLYCPPPAEREEILALADRDMPSVQDAIDDIIRTPCTYAPLYCTSRHLACIARHLIARGWVSPKQAEEPAMVQKAIDRLSLIERDNRD